MNEVNDFLFEFEIESLYYFLDVKEISDEEI